MRFGHELLMDLERIANMLWKCRLNVFLRLATSLKNIMEWALTIVPNGNPFMSVPVPGMGYWVADVELWRAVLSDFGRV